MSFALETTAAFRFLRLDLLRPGDVLLTRSLGGVGRSIALLSGPYTHAGILITRDMLFESTLGGVILTPLVIDRAEKHPAGVIELHGLSDTLEALVLRHPAFNAIHDTTSFSEWLFEASTLTLGLDYPDLTRLAAAAYNFPLVQTAVRLVPLIIESPRPLLPGPFCSELVAAIFECFGYPLFPNRAHSSISPSAFLESELEIVECAISAPTDVACDRRIQLQSSEAGMRRNSYIAEYLRELEPFKESLARSTASRLDWAWQQWRVYRLLAQLQDKPWLDLSDVQFI